MRLAERRLTIGDFRRLGAFEIYAPAAVAAFAASREPRQGEPQEQVSDDLSFPLEDLFAADTKLRRQLWLARQPGVLPMALMHRFGLVVAQRTIGRLNEEGVLSDIRLTAALSAQAAFLDGKRHARSIEQLRAAVQQAVLDHGAYASARAAMGCATVHAALDQDGHEAGAQAVYHHLELFPKDQHWSRSQLLELIRNW
jgi:hypothetical protein